MKKSIRQRKRKYTLFFLCLTTLTIVGLMVYSSYAGRSIAERYAPLIDAAMEIRLQATMAHLWFEEVISGDSNESIDKVWKLIDEAEWYAKAMLVGGKNKEGAFRPLESQLSKKRIGGALKSIHKFREIAHVRWKKRESFASGSANDQEFDRVFRTLIASADEVETALQLEMARTLKVYSLTQWLLLLLVILASIATGLLLRRYEEAQEEHMRKLFEQKVKLETMLRSIGDGVIAADVKGRVALLNSVAEKLTGWTTVEAKGKPLTEVFKILNAQTGEALTNPVAKVLEEGEIVGLANGTKLVSADGTEYLIADSASPIKNENDDVSGVILVFRDVTEEHALQEQLRHSQKLDAIGRLAGGVAHDFNNMLSGIMGSADLLREDLEGKEDGLLLVDLIVDSAKRAASLACKLLAFSRKQLPGSTPINVHDTIEETVAILRNTIDKRISIDVSLDATSSVVVGDSSQLQSVFLNLGINASHAMVEGGKFSISTENVDLDEDSSKVASNDLEPGAYIRLEFRDTGCGMAEDVKEHIFEPFFTTKEQGKGTGLGLAAAYGTIRQHDGAINVYSEEGEGTCFVILLPLTAKAAAELPAREEAICGEGLILIVDDEEVMRITGSSLLTSYGYDVLVACDGQEALEIYEEKHNDIDLVILDMIMPKMNGRDCFFTMQKINSAARIIVSSGFSRSDDLLELKKAGLAGFIKKPFCGAELSHIVARALRDS